MLFRGDSANKARIVSLCLAAAVIYGVVHDQITARLCIEYFTVAHPPLFSATSATVVALCWGVAATAGIGAVFGVVLALVCQAGDAPPLAASLLVGRIARLVAGMAVSAIVAGVSGYVLALHGVVSMPSSFSELIPAVRHNRFIAVWFAHAGSYIAGLYGGSTLVFGIWRERGKPAVLALFPRTPAAAFRSGILVLIAAYIAWRRIA